MKGQADSEGQFAGLKAGARSRIGTPTPEWSDHNDSDPGFTILELIAFLLASLVFFGSVIRLLRAAGLIDRVEWRVTVEDGWSRVDDLSESGPDDRHFVLDPETGEVRFGDGMHGAKPPTGSTSVKASYQFGGGAVGAVGASVVVWAGLLTLWCRLRGRRPSVTA
jgi:hypothetical protein